MKKHFLLAMVIITSNTLIGCDESLFNSMFPPDDFYDPILSLDIGASLETYSDELVHVYKGIYSISLIFEHGNRIGTQNELMGLDIICLIQYQESIVDIPCGSELLPFWGEESGISLGIYRIPDVAPQKENVRFTLEFEDISQLQRLSDLHGSIILKIEKWSDL